jgi:poly(beta-D-mannuronate) lyase
VDPKLRKDDRGVWRLAAGSAAIGKGVGSYPFVTVDVDGQARPEKGLDVGADQLVAGGVTRHPLTEAEVGPKAPEEGDRPLISGPKAEWIPKAAGPK